MLTRVNGLVRGQTTSYAERRVALGGGSGRARSAQGKPSGDRGDTLATARSMLLTGTLLVAQDETPQGPSHIAPITIQLFDATPSGAHKEPRGRGVRAVCRLSLGGVRRPPHGSEPRACVGPARRERRGVHALLRTAQARRRRLGRGDARPLARGPSDRRPAQPHDVPRAEG